MTWQRSTRFRERAERHLSIDSACSIVIESNVDTRYHWWLILVGWWVYFGKVFTAG